MAIATLSEVLVEYFQARKALLGAAARTRELHKELNAKIVAVQAELGTQKKIRARLKQLADTLGPMLHADGAGIIGSCTSLERTLEAELQRVETELAALNDAIAPDVAAE